ncbi:MAG: hypothetical protein PHR28_04180 [candidate division Zixibacteria bacterium]|nr:hypothetical protein [candidate division Zixibacteria bacterium]
MIPCTKQSPNAIVVAIALVGVLSGGSAYSDALDIVHEKPSTYPIPYYDYALHDVGQLGLLVSNHGIIGPGWVDFAAPSCDFPLGSLKRYFNCAGLIVGGLRRSDSLVTDMWEFRAGFDANAAIKIQSSVRSSPYYNAEARSEQDFICTYADTFVDPGQINPYDNRLRIPLNIEVTERSYSWSYSYAADFVLFHFTIRNIGPDSLRKLFLGYEVMGNPYYYNEYNGDDDALCGFRRLAKSSKRICPTDDTIAVAWIADNDGDPNGELEWDVYSLPSAVGIQILGTSRPYQVFNYNWWALYDDWGPRKAGTEDNPYRDFGIGMGDPRSDRNWYYMLSHPEFDYDQLFSAFDHSNEGFFPPPKDALDYANGAQIQYVLSFGPYDLAPGDSVSFAMALVAGENFHVNPSDFEEIFGTYNPIAYFATLNFDDLDRNARWAEYVYDNPGVDTDHDGYAGEYCWSYAWRDTTPDIPDDSFVVDSHKVYYKGDSIPDFRTVAPPPAPIVRTFPSYGQIIIRWNGRDSETAVDFLTQDKSFEGYRVYMGKEDRLSDFVLLSSFDIEDYVIWQYSDLLGDWVKQGLPVTRDSLKILYGPDFDPTQYDNQYHAFTDPTTGAYRFFAPQDWNQSDLSDPLKIHKLYPDASKDNPDDTTDEGNMRYYEYEYVIDNLQPSEPCYLSVTAFSRGSLDENVGVLETSPLVNVVRDFPLPSSTMVEKEGLKVIVYPNPYRVGDGYARDGYENRDRLKRVEWSREIHFGNLPAVCKIRIYTLAGDLVQEIDHYYPNGGPGSQEETWNMISRNTQSITSGIYIWSVHSDKTDQLGKLVIIK